MKPTYLVRIMRRHNDRPDDVVTALTPDIAGEVAEVLLRADDPNILHVIITVQMELPVPPVIETPIPPPF